MGAISVFFLAWLTSFPLFSSQTFEIGSYILTQYALDDAPTRYATWIQEALSVLNSQTLSDYSDSQNFCWFGDYHYTIELSKAYYNFTLDHSSIIVEITDSGFYTAAIFNFYMATPAYSGGYVGGWFVCWHETDCDNDLIYVWATIYTEVNVSIIWNTDTLSASVIPNIDVNTVITNYNVDNCGEVFSLFASWYSNDLKSEISTVVNDAIDQQIASISNELNVPQTFYPYDGVKVTYNITDLQFAGNDYAKMSAQGMLFAQNTNTDLNVDHTSWYVFEDESNIDASIRPPTTWPESPYFAQNDSETAVYLLNGLRLSSTLFTALMWAADTSGQLNPNYTFNVLDATLIFKFEWSIPIMKIPANNTLILELTYGNINGTCYETDGDVTDQHTVIDFEVYNLTANGTVDIIESDDTLYIEIDEFNLDNINLSLLAPPIPLPENVINALLKEMLNATVPYLNDWLDSHSFNVPDNVADYLPNPQLSLIHQNQYNYTEHGYVQLLSTCACSEDDNSLYSACSGLQCVFPTISPYPTLIPTGNPSESPTMEPTLSPSNAPTVYRNYTTSSPTLPPYSNYSVWLYLFNGDTMKYKLEDNVCAIESIGDQEYIIKLSNTDSVCELLTGSFLFEGLSDDYNHYMLNMDISDNDISSVGLFCNNDCSYCSYTSDKIDFGVCYNNITVKSNEYNIMFMEYNNTLISNSTTIINNETVQLMNYNDDICYGGNAKMLYNDSLIWITYQYSMDCNSYSISMQNFGAFNSCIIQNGGQYNIMSSYLNEYGNETFYYFNSGCNSSCSVDSCTYTQYGLKESSCSTSHNSSSQFMFSKDLSICGKEVQYGVINGTTPSPTPTNTSSSTSLSVAIISTIVSVVIILVIIIIVCIWKRKKLIPFMKDRFIPMVNDLFKMFIGSFGCSVGKLSQQELIETFAMCLCFAILIWQSLTWKSSSPWDVFSYESFERLGVDMSYLDTTELMSMLDAWSDFGAVVSTMFAVLCAASVMFRIILIKPESTSIWTWMRISVLFTYICLHFFIWVGPSMKYDFKDSMKIDRSNISNSTLQESHEIIDDVDWMLGYAFIGIFLSYLSNLMLFWISSIPVACYVICMIFIIRQFNDDNNNIYGFISYNVEPNAKIQLFTRLKVCLCMFQGLSSIIEALPVIILYQSFGVDVGWIILWCIWWSIPMICLFWLTYILSIYIIQMKTPHNYCINKDAKKSLLLQNTDDDDLIISDVKYSPSTSLKCLRLQLWINITIYFVQYLITIMVAIHKEKSYASDLDFSFIQCNIVSTFVISAVFTFCGLHQLFSQYQHKNDINNDMEDTQNITEMIDLDDMNNNNKMTDIDDEKQKEDGPEIEPVPVEIEMSKRKKQAQCCYFSTTFHKWFLEKKERQNSRFYGERVLYRRIFLLVGTAMFGYSVIDQLRDILNTTVKQEVIDFLDDMDLQVEWPDNQHGGTIFDDAFELYNTARQVEIGLATAALFCFVIASLFDVCKRDRNGLKKSRYFCWAAILLLFTSILSTALPNYLRDTDITSITPYCAPNFNEAIDLVSGDIVGILCSAIFTVTLLPVLIAVPPSLVRATFLVIHESNIFKLDKYQIETLISIIIVASFLTPLMTFFPLLVFQQLMGDAVTAVIIIFGWVLPIVVAFLFKLIKYKKYAIEYKKCRVECSVFLYGIWLFFMLGSLLLIIIYEFVVYGVPGYFIQLIQTFDFYCEFIAEVFLANVVISDFLYANL